MKKFAQLNYKSMFDDSDGSGENDYGDDNNGSSNSNAQLDTTKCQSYYLADFPLLCRKTFMQSS